MIILVGPDGCGKSTIAVRLIDKLQQDGLAVRHQHWRPHILPSPRLFVGQTPHGDPTRPHDKTKHSFLPSLLLSSYYWLDFWLGYLLKIVPFERKGGIVIAERYIYDMLFDPLRHRLRISEEWAATICRRSPQPHLLVALTGDPQELYNRKREIAKSEIEHQQDRIRAYFRDYPQAVFISTTDMSVEDTIRKIIEFMKGVGIYG